MFRPDVVWQTRRRGGGVVVVRKRHGGGRTIRFDSGPTRLAKLLGLASVLGRLGAATTVPLAGDCLTAQVTATVDDATPLVPRAGPAVSPLTLNGP